MIKNFTYILLVPFCLAILAISSCESAYLVYDDSPIPDTVKFSMDIQPIFNESCNTSGCHAQGGYTPYLTESDAYMNLMVYGMVDVSDAESSIIYTRLTSINNPMPPDGNLPVNKTELILKWIRQGAMDN
ncbi:MAG: hypothetical protein WD052_12720 [Bacteroidales bacterium]